MKQQRVKAGERGQVLVLFVFALALLMGFVALSIDVGLAYVNRREMMNAADAAVLAGAARLKEGASPVVAAAEAQEFAESNGYVNGEGDVSVSINVPPSSGPYSGDGNYIEVVIEREVDMVFATVLGQSTWTVTARAVAGIDPQSAGSYAIMVLSETDCFAFDNTGSGNISIEGGGIMVNSNCSTAFRHAGSGNIDVSAIHYYYGGGYKIVGSGNVTPTPSPVASPIVDPLAGLAPPLPGAPAPGSTGTADDPQLTLINNSNDRTLYPGTYYGGLKIVGSGNVTFEQGIYIMAGGGLELSASGNMTGTDITFYNTNDPVHPTGAGAFGSFKLASSGNVDFGAPSTGPYPYMLFWQDASNTQTFLKASSGNLSPGIIYLPTAKLDESSSGNMGAVQIVVDEYDKSGSGNVEMTSGGWVGESLAAVRLVE